MDPSSLFQGDIDDNLKKVVITIDIIKKYVEMFESFREKVESYFKPPAEPILWTFHQKLIFGRLFAFETRLKEIKVQFIVHILSNDVIKDD